MRVMTQKSLDYLKNNPKVADFLTKDIQIYEKKSTLPKDFNYNLM